MDRGFVGGGVGVVGDDALEVEGSGLDHFD